MIILGVGIVIGVAGLLLVSFLFKLASPDKKEVPTSNGPEEALPINETVFIKYVDAGNSFSSRKITIKAFTKTQNGDISLNTYCHERKAARTFLLSRVKEMTDVDTGEVLGDPKTFLLDRYANSDTAMLVTWLKKLKSEIAVLIYVARVDGRFSEKERFELAKFIVEKSGGEVEMGLLEDDLRRSYCDDEEFISHLAVLRNYSDFDKSALIAAAQRIASATKGIEEREDRAIRAIISHLGVKQKQPA